ncbi:hypothetical protein AALM99_02680 [Lactococcus muris]|uniref:Uncharacterized protein n=1 Tax=Lactococcus muris TaxID=2941330 RepID=A0ABV4D8E5_9LACT
MPISKLSPKEDKTVQKEKRGNLTSFLEHTFYKRLNKTKEAELILVDDTVLQMFRIEGTGASSVSYEEQRMILSYFYTFLSKTNEHFTIETTKLPVSTASQVAHLRRKLRNLTSLKPTSERGHLQLEIKKNMIRAKIEKQKELEERLSNIEYLLFLYAETPRELHKKSKQLVSLARSYRFHLSMLNPKEKELVLFQLNNLNTKL